MISFPVYLLAIAGTPLFTVIAALALISFHRTDIDLTVVFIEMYRLASVLSRRTDLRPGCPDQIYAL